jgi:hypothetical protein
MIQVACPGVEGHAMRVQSALCVVYAPFCIMLSGEMDPTEGDRMTQSIAEEASF